MIVAGYGIGVPLNSCTAYLVIRSNFDPVLQTFTGSAYDIGRLSIALGHLGVLMLLCKSGVMRWLTDNFAAIGRMAFSNYIFHSVVCSVFFTGYGFAMYVVAAIWIVQMIVSPIWLKHYRFGPLEWGWRALTYWKKQPMRRVLAREAVAAASA